MVMQSSRHAPSTTTMVGYGSGAPAAPARHMQSLLCPPPSQVQPANVQGTRLPFHQPRLPPAATTITCPPPTPLDMRTPSARHQLQELVTRHTQQQRPAAPQPVTSSFQPGHPNPPPAHSHHRQQTEQNPILPTIYEDLAQRSRRRQLKSRKERQKELIREAVYYFQTGSSLLDHAMSLLLNDDD